ncbi:hypothetical protein [Arthrobacter sp. N1]|uniref:hypothetical protein n=1 Tax=Arthrobacter sp. N1 TaxID=619291 RepID=UPI003BB1FA7C
MKTNPARVAPGIPTGGQFAHQQRSEAGVALANRKGASLDALIERASNLRSEEHAQSLRDELAAIQTDGGVELFRRNLDAEHNPHSPWTWSEHASFDNDEWDRLAELSVEDAGQYADDSVKMFRSGRSAFLENIPAERLRLLAELHVPKSDQWSPVERLAYLSADLDALRELANIPAKSTGRYRAAVALVRPALAERYDQSVKEQVFSKAFIESGRPIGVLADLKKHLRNATDEEIIDFAARSIRPAQIDLYGQQACSNHSRRDLEASGLDPASVKQLTMAKQDASIQEMKALSGSGITTFKHYQNVRHAMQSSDAGAYAAAARHAAPPTLHAYRVVNGAKLSAREAEMVGALVKHGHDDPASIAGFSRAEPLADRGVRVSIIQRAHDAVQAKVPMKEAVAFSRAGVPSEAIARCAGLDPWVAGEMYRREYEREQQDAFKRGWVTKPAKWPHTAESVRGESIRPVGRTPQVAPPR